mmetsp:Transcript_35743/g.101152  ORF Transcript_35743/g.101152 Transcript_35743/m.101152 type:complete len:590 (-) Transcript_35743:7-1776(-)
MSDLFNSKSVYAAESCTVKLFLVGMQQEGFNKNEKQDEHCACARKARRPPRRPYASDFSHRQPREALSSGSTATPEPPSERRRQPEDAAPRAMPHIRYDMSDSAPPQAAAAVPNMPPQQQPQQQQQQRQSPLHSSKPPLPPDPEPKPKAQDQHDDRSQVTNSEPHSESPTTSAQGDKATSGGRVALQQRLASCNFATPLVSPRRIEIPDFTLQSEAHMHAIENNCNVQKPPEYNLQSLVASRDFMSYPPQSSSFSGSYRGKSASLSSNDLTVKSSTGLPFSNFSERHLPSTGLFTPEAYDMGEPSPEDTRSRHHAYRLKVMERWLRRATRAESMNQRPTCLASIIPLESRLQAPPSPSQLPGYAQAGCTSGPFSQEQQQKQKNQPWSPISPLGADLNSQDTSLGGDLAAADKSGQRWPLTDLAQQEDSCQGWGPTGREPAEPSARRASSGRRIMLYPIDMVEQPDPSVRSPGGGYVRMLQVEQGALSPTAGVSTSAAARNTVRSDYGSRRVDSSGAAGVPANHMQALPSPPPARRQPPVKQQATGAAADWRNAPPSPSAIVLRPGTVICPSERRRDAPMLLTLPPVGVA